MKSYKLFLMCGAAATLTACNSSEVTGPEINKKEMSFLCEYGTETRVTDTSFDTNDNIGVYVTKADEPLFIGGNVVNNELFSYDGSVWKASRNVFWDEGIYNVYAYYPYSQAIGDIEDYIFDVESDQSTVAAFKASDFVWATVEGIEASESPVKLRFSHCMSKVKIQLEKGEGFTGDIPSDCEVYIHSTIGQASIDLSSGGVSKNSIAGTKSIKALKMSDESFEAILVPQNIETRRPLVEVVTNGVSYMMDGKISLKPGYSHTIVITLSKNPSQIKIEIGGSIGGWN